MIISASRRTDIPALYPEWFMNRLRAGEVLVQNPYNSRKADRIPLSPDIVDCIIFWTKNPGPLIPYLREMDRTGYRYGFQMTITGYEEDIEPQIPRIEDSMATFILLSEMLGQDRVVWRFDPVFLTKKYTLDYHEEKFDMMCRWLSRATDRCIISFLDARHGGKYQEPAEDEIEQLARRMEVTAIKHGFRLYTCAEKMDLSAYGISHGACIGKDWAEQIAGYRLDVKRDKGQRQQCRCVESVDIGAYNTCTGGCAYCYANGEPENVRKKCQRHDPGSPLLIGRPEGDVQITGRKIYSNKDEQISLFDLMKI